MSAETEVTETTTTEQATEPEGNRGDLNIALSKERAAAKAARDKAADLQSKLDAIEAEKVKTAEAEMAQRGEYQQLLAQREAELEAERAKGSTLAEQVAKMQADAEERSKRIAEANDAAMKALPETVQSFVNKASEGLSPERVQELIAEAQGMAAAPPPKHAQAGRTAGGEPAADPESLTEAERKWLERERPSMLTSGANNAALKRYVQKATRAAT